MSAAGADVRPGETATLAEADRDGSVALVFAGRLDADGVAQLWTPTLAAASGARDRKLLFDLSAVSICDTAGATLLVAAEQAHGAPAALRGASQTLVGLIDRVRAALETPPAPQGGGKPLGLWPLLLSGLTAAASGVAFLGEVAVAIVRAPQRLRMLRPPDILGAAD